LGQALLPGTVLLSGAKNVPDGLDLNDLDVNINPTHFGSNGSAYPIRFAEILKKSREEIITCDGW